MSKKPVPPKRAPKRESPRPDIVPMPDDIETAREMAERAGHIQGCRYLTASEIARLRGHVDPAELEETQDLAEGIAQIRAGLAARQGGFSSLLELCAVLSIAAAISLSAVPSLLMHTNTVALQSAVATFKWTLMRVPALPLDPSWTQVGNTYSHAMTRPAGTLSITQPTTVGGAWGCAFSDPTYSVRCN